ncbi:DNA cytosine methyltransferase [Gracilibacillus oryzae]|uniref:Cytosine-specific methyltransferase n=1 Tax=Gracilibacillus oryzae TaxID=1672701 RepID=A0A7C8GQ87_9BACI|nr:DNA cytosine methyltransferase [Gracilibacillus oryzae]KAB8126060.1 DNA cytosine methyltransferase [Gracilibacillus oryzae]
MKDKTIDTLETLSTNVFDRNVLSKKEFLEMIENFITTVSWLKNSVVKDTDYNLYSLSSMVEFGIINSEDEIEELDELLGRDLFEDLLASINYVIEDELIEYPDIAKFSKVCREKLIDNEEKSNKPTLVDLFCGAGGLSLGFTQEGFRVVFANDIDKAALRTYSFNHPEIDGKRVTLGGIEDIAHNIHHYIGDSVDVIAGGPPCQGFSTANRQRIIDDPRNVLYKYYVESVKRLLPKFFIMENVKGMKNVAEQVIVDFNDNIAVGYDIDFEIFNARNFGVPQNRERLIYIGIREDIKKERGVTAEEIIKLIRDEHKDVETGLMDAIDSLRKLEASRIKNSTELGDDISGYKISKVSKNIESEYVSRINNGEKVSLTYNHKARYNNDRDIEIFGRMLPGDKSDSPRIADIMPYTSRNHMFKDKYFKLIPEVPCKTITAHMKFDCNMYIHPYQARGLTPREAARVQSYPDSYFFLGAYTKTYQQIGNSVPPLMARAIAGKIQKYV